MFSPLVFLALSVAWLALVLFLIWRGIARINAEAQADAKWLAQMERRQVDYCQQPEPRVLEAIEPH